MTQSELTLHFEQGLKGGATVRKVVLEGVAEVNRRLNGQPFFFHFPDRVLPDPAVLDGPLFSVMMIASQIGIPRLRVRGPLSVQALRNARIYMEAWRCMLPRNYRVVEIVPDRVVTAPLSGEGKAVSAFSGGLDATFLALRHAGKMLGPASYDLTGAVMIHGFDVNWRDTEAFDRLRRRVAPLLDKLNLELITVRTNAKCPSRFQPQKWEYTFAAQVAGVLHNLSHQFDYALIGSSEPYDALMPTCGSNPTTDYLLSGGAMQIVHEGAAYQRTEKAAIVARDQVALKTLKVCWEGEQQDRNCGACEKCVRTRLNFLAVGAKDPPCFDTPFEEALIDSILPANSFALAELRGIVAYADRRGLKGAWLDRLKARIGQLETMSIPTA